MRKFNVYFSFADEFKVFIKNDFNIFIEIKDSIMFSNSKDLFFSKLLSKKDQILPTDYFLVGLTRYDSLEELVKGLKNKGENIRLLEGSDKEEKVQEEVECDTCDGSGDSDKKDRYGEWQKCYRCDGRGKTKKWK